MGKLGPRLVQRFFGELALGYILQCTDEDRMTAPLRHDAGHAPQVLQGPLRSHDSESEVYIRARHATCDYGLKSRQVFGVDRVPYHLHGDLACRIEFEDAEC